MPWCFYSNSGPAPTQCHNNGFRKNCGFTGINQEGCQSRGCCWNPVNNGGATPWCFFPNDAPFPGYMVVSQAQSSLGITLQLAPINNSSTPYGTPLQSIQVQATYLSKTILEVKITDNNNARYEVPSSLFPRPVQGPVPATKDYVFSYTENPFGFAITRASNGDVLFNTSAPNADGTSWPFNNFVFADQFWELSTSLPSQASLYGLGESTQTGGVQLSTGSTYTLWNRDCPSAVTNQNLYGSHPFYLDLRPSGNSHGVFLLNSNGMDISYASDGTSLTYKVIGGLPDFYFITGPTPASVIRDYTSIIGNPHMPPLWSLGFHQSRYGYPNIQTVESVVANYAKANIPLEVMWNDIDYMDQYKDFTFDPINYPVAQVGAFVKQLHSNGQKYVVIVDPGIASTDPNYLPFQRGNQANIWIRDGQNNPFQGKVWPGLVYFPDFIHPQAQSYWQTEISDFLAQVPVDGLWIDMNEISNFCDGECENNNENNKPMRKPSTGFRTRKTQRVTAVSDAIDTVLSVAKHPRPHRSSSSNSRASAATTKDQFNPTNPPYTINDCGSGCPLKTKTISMDAVHYPYTLGDDDITEYNLHNLYGFSESIATRKSLENLTNKRAFVITRSTFPGSGKHVGHWTGDNASEWPDLAYSITGILNFNLFGVPMVGADICGFLGSTTEELCARWIELGSFYTFCRNHNTEGAPSQELYLWPDVAAISRTVLTNRYRLAPYYYTLFYLAHSLGDTILRPLFWEFANDTQTFGVNSQFMVGPALLITPVLTQGATSVSGYFPAGLWYDWWTGASYILGPATQTIDAPLNVIPVHMRGGQMIPTQRYAGTGSIVRNDPYDLYVAFDASYNVPGTGTLFVDDGENIPMSNYLFVNYTVSSPNSSTRILINTIINMTYQPANNIGLGSIVIYGQPRRPTKVVLNNMNWTSQVLFNSTTHVLTVPMANLTITSLFSLTWTLN